MSWMVLLLTMHLRGKATVPRPVERSFEPTIAMPVSPAPSIKHRSIRTCSDTESLAGSWAAQSPSQEFHNIVLESWCAYIGGGVADEDGVALHPIEREVCSAAVDNSLHPQRPLAADAHVSEVRSLRPGAISQNAGQCIFSC